MEKSKALELVWKIALIEAVGSKNEEIFPEHFLCGLLKFVELPKDKISALLSGNEESLGGVLAEQKKLAEMTTALKVDTTRVRRALRKKVPRGDLEKIRQIIRRSPKSRELFLKAEARADAHNSTRLRTYDVLQTLLENPTPHIQSVLDVSEETMTSLPTPEDTPTLNRFGRNILKEEPEAEATPEATPQVKALGSHLEARHPDPLILVAAEAELSKTIARQTAAAFGEALPGPLLVLDYADLASAEKEPLALLRQILEEARQSGAAVLFLEHFETPLQEDKAFRAGLLETLQAKTAPLLLGVSETAFRKALEKNPGIRSCRTMWLHPLDQDDDVPLEL